MSLLKKDYSNFKFGEKDTINKYENHLKNHGILYMDVNYAEKELVKKAGAKFNFQLKLWYIDKTFDINNIHDFFNVDYRDKQGIWHRIYFMKFIEYNKYLCSDKYTKQEIIEMYEKL